MPRFFVDKENMTEENGEILVTIKGEDAHHISRSLRMAVGEKIEVCDKDGTVYNCVLTGFTDKDVFARALSSEEADSEPKTKITLYQALPKSDKMETIIQKTIECGVYKIVPFRSDFCVVKLDSRDGEKKRERWQKIAEGAAKQSGRGMVPQVKGVKSFKELLESLSGTVLFCYEAEDTVSIKKALRENKIQGEVSVIIGSEGGFSQKEADQLKTAGAISVGLGKRILRCETAPVFALSCLVYELEL